MTNCEICNELLCTSVEGQRNHYKRFHSLTLTVVKVPHLIKPFRLTKRSKAQIVHDQEKLWGYAIMPPVKPWHSLAAI